ncbi:MAG: MFS transporter [Gemmataceae bacterium]|nr:MFS transporter [Gemmataceae bacterium]
MSTLASLSPRALKPDQIEQYLKQGYLIVRQVFSPFEIAMLVLEAERLLERRELIHSDNVGFIVTTLGVGAMVMAEGWRDAWATLGLALLIGLAPVSWLLVRSSPESCGLSVEGEAITDPAVKTQTRDVSLVAALGTSAFWAFSLATSLFGLVWSAITLFNQSILAERGFDARTFYLVMALLTGSGLVANLVGGWLAQRWALGRLLFIGMSLLALSLAGFPLVGTTAHVVLYGLGLGVAGGLITVVHFAFYGQAFGRTNLGQIQGAAQVLSVFTSALGPLALAICKERFGSYDAMFYSAAPVALVLGTAAWLVPAVHSDSGGDL